MLYQMYSDRRLGKIRPVLQKPKFAGVTATNSSDAWVYLVGRVDSEESQKSLEEEMRSLFGDEDGRRMMLGVEVSKK